MEIAQSDDKPVKNSINLRVRNQMAKKERKIETTSEPRTSDTPYIIYFDFIREKRAGVTQNDVYVKRAMEILVNSNIFKNNGITELEWFSDGCGKVWINPALIII